jgi:hypothetical protein
MSWSIGLKGIEGGYPRYFHDIFSAGSSGKESCFKAVSLFGVCGEKPRSARLKQRVGLDRRRTQRGRNCHLSQV